MANALVFQTYKDPLETHAPGLTRQSPPLHEPIAQTGRQSAASFTPSKQSYTTTTTTPGLDQKVENKTSKMLNVELQDKMVRPDPNFFSFNSPDREDAKSPPAHLDMEEFEKIYH